jgi:exosome complex RNA-binding protein Rrp4
LYLNRYIGEVGDLVVGRISSIEANRWKVDIHSQKVSEEEV